MGSAASGLPLSKCVPAEAVRWPPAEKPMMPTRSAPHAPFGGARPHRADGALRIAKLDGVVIFRAQADISARMP